MCLNHSYDQSEKQQSLRKTEEYLYNPTIYTIIDYE